MDTKPAEITPLNNLMNLPSRIVENFLAKIVKDATTGCWNWSGHRNIKGYGQFRWSSDTKISPSPAHRISYQLSIGPILDSLHIHHKCENPACVNPEHLEPITPGAHSSITNYKTTYIRNVATHCGKGHEFTPENTGRVESGLRRGQRFCRECARIREEEQAAVRKGAIGPKLLTHCQNGHEFTPENTIHKIIRGRTARQCLQCRRERERITSKSYERKEWLNRYRREKRAKAKADRLKPDA